MKDHDGFTLVELVVVVALISICLAMVTLNFTRLNEKFTVESDIKEIYSILMRSRNDASKTNTQQLVVFGANQLQTGQDANGDNVIDGVAVTNSYPTLTINCGVNPCAGDIFSFDRRGLANINQTINITGFPADTVPAMDCITIAATRINMGIMTGGNCDHR